MTEPSPQIADHVRHALLAAFGDIAAKTGLNPTHLNMKLRLEDGTRLQAEATPIAEGGSGDIVVEVE